MESKLKPGKIYIDTKGIRFTSTFLKFIKSEDGFYYFKIIGGAKNYTKDKDGLVCFSDRYFTEVESYFREVSKKDLIKHIDYLNSK